MVSLRWASASAKTPSAAAAGSPVSAAKRRSRRWRRGANAAANASASSASGEGVAAPAECLLVALERGPLLCLRLGTGCWPASASLTSLALCREHLRWRHWAAAVDLLLSLDWNGVHTFQDVEQEDLLLACLTSVVQTLLNASNDRVRTTSRFFRDKERITGQSPVWDHLANQVND